MTWVAVGTTAVSVGAGYLNSKNTSKAPTPVQAPPPGIPGGYSGQYGGMYYDPTTGSTQQLGWNFDPSQMGQSLQNQSLYNQIMGTGNSGINRNLDFQAQQLQQQIARLQGQQGTGSGNGIGGQKSFAQLAGWDPNGANAKAWLDKDGNPKDPGSITRSDRAMVDLFNAQTGGNYGPKANNFERWVQDAYNKNIKGVATQYKQSQDVNVGNTDQRAQALKSLQTQLSYIQQSQKDMADPTKTGLAANNPLMNFLNQRNQTPGKDYSTMFQDPNVASMQAESDYYKDKSHQNIPGYDPNKSAEAYGIPDAKAYNAKMMAQYGGALGGERMAPIGAYDGSRVGDFTNNLNRQAAKASQSQQQMIQEQNARRGLLGGSSEVGQLAAAQSLADSMANNAAQGYGMDQNDRQNWFNRKFAVDSHNSDVARTGAQASLSYGQQGFGNEMSAAQLLNSLRNQDFGNNQSAQLQNYNEMMGTLGQHTALNQNVLNNQRTEEGLDQNNFNNRMSLLNMISGQQNQANQFGLQSTASTQNGAGLNNNIQQSQLNNTNAWNASNTAMQNSYNNAQWLQGVNQQAQNTNSMGQIAGALGTAYGNYEPSQPTGAPPVDTSGLPTQPRQTTGQIPMPGQTQQTTPQYSTTPTSMQYTGTGYSYDPTNPIGGYIPSVGGR